MADRKRIEIPIGPQHPALKEPESFRLELAGEKIMKAGVRLGYNHRGIEKACEARTYIQDIYLIERVCGICSHSHSTCFVQAVEEIANLQPPPRAQYIRTLVGELERIHSHLLWLGVAGHEVGFDTLLMYTWADREIVMDLLAALTGNRVNYGLNTFGGVRRDVSPEQKEAILKGMDVLEERTKYYVQIATEETTLIQRLSGVGMLLHDDAVRMGAVGPTGRASGLARDIRKDDPYAAYDKVSFNVITDTHCDVYGRAVVRVLELMESYKIVRQVLKDMPEGPVTVKAPRKIPVGEAVSRYEAPRGEDLHYVKANGTEKPERVKVRAPTLANVQAVAHMLKDRNLADVPIVVAAIDPCFSCTDRLIAVAGSSLAASTGTDIVTWEQLRQYSIEWHRRQGIDFTDLNRTFRAGMPEVGGGDAVMQYVTDLFYMLVFPGFAFLAIFSLAAEFIDRKLYAKLQRRIGPPWFQPLADLIKLAAKEDVMPTEADRWMYTLTPIVALASTVTAFIYIPVWSHTARQHFEGDVIVVLYLLTIPTFTFFLGGWYSRSVFSMIGAARTITQLFAYEIPLFLSILAAALLTDEWSLSGMSVKLGEKFSQYPLLAILNILGFIVALIALLGKLERVPFDIPDAETEIGAGCFTEYSGRLLALFRMAISIEMIVGASLLAAVFMPFGLDWGPVAGFAFFLAKVLSVVCLITLARTVMARLRIDQMINFCWKIAAPMAFVQLMINLVAKGMLAP